MNLALHFDPSVVSRREARELMERYVAGLARVARGQDDYSVSAAVPTKVGTPAASRS